MQIVTNLLSNALKFVPAGTTPQVRVWAEKRGHEVLAWLRQQPGLKRLPVVVLTSSQQDIDIDRAYALGANSYLVKPLASRRKPHAHLGTVRAWELIGGT